MSGDSGVISRRQFIITTAAGVATCVAGYPSFLHAAEEVDLAVISGEPATATRKALEVLGGIARFVKKGQRVIIKPNMSFARTPDFAATTHPQVVVAVARACIDAGAKEVLVLDHTLQRAELCLERAGIRDACRNIPGVHVLALQDRKFFREIRIPQGKVLERVEVLTDILDNAVLINTLLRGAVQNPQSDFGYASFSQTLLAGADFSNASLPLSNLGNAQISRAVHQNVQVTIKIDRTVTQTQLYTANITTRPAVTGSSICPDRLAAPCDFSKAAAHSGCTVEGRWTPPSPPTYIGTNDPGAW